jgi:hypothetical protein
MSTKALSAPTGPSKQGRSTRPSSEPPVSSSGRDELHSFLHGELRISNEVADLYCNSLIQNGYDDVASLQDATDQDLKELGVKIGHIRRIKRAVFSSCARSERRTSSGGGTRMMPALSLEITEEGVSRKLTEESLLSEYARQEMTNYTPPRRDRTADMDLVTAKELLIRKQAEKIAALEAKLADTSINSDLDDESRSHANESSRVGSADGQSKKLTPGERLELHRQRKLEENKYKEKSGMWDAPPPKENDANITKKISENDDLVIKLSSDRIRRKKIEEVEKKVKMVKKAQVDDAVGLSSNGRPNPQSSNGHKQDDSSSIRIRKPVSCATCGSTRDCEPDVDNPGTYYCASCWDQYDGAYDEPATRNHVVCSQPGSKNNASNEKDPIHHALWIVHDNPQLGDKIVYSGPKKMECMLETKEPGKKNCVRIIMGDIDFIGKVKDGGIGRVGARETEIGTECIRLRNAKGFYVDHNLAASRLSKDKSVYEFHLGAENAHVLTGEFASMTVAEFFKDCNGAIDVILDPQKDVGGWYPQREAGDGGRRVAPQFRSKGVGYIRLGDDMSENGLAFLSSNACSTFLSSTNKMATPANSAVSNAAKSSKNKEDSEESAPKVLPPAAKPVLMKKEQKVEALPTAPRGKPKLAHQPTPSQQDESDDASSEDESDDEEGNVTDLLKQLQSPEEANMKWKDKAELLSQLGKRAAKPDSSSSRSAALTVIEDTISGKNVNIHVLRSSLIAVGMIGVAMGGDLVSQLSWKTIMIESLKQLKNKQCSSVAKTVLAQLHGKSFTLSNSMDCVAHVLGIGKAASAPKPRQSGTNAGNASCIEVFEWLAEAVERERSMDVIDPMLDESGLGMLINLFYSHADHRDQKCRKSVMDGLLHSVLYGVQRLDMELARAMSMCSGLKETNPKGWNQLLSSVKNVIERGR